MSGNADEDRRVTRSSRGRQPSIPTSEVQKIERVGDENQLGNLETLYRQILLLPRNQQYQAFEALNEGIVSLQDTNLSRLNAFSPSKNSVQAPVDEKSQANFEYYSYKNSRLLSHIHIMIFLRIKSQRKMGLVVLLRRTPPDSSR